MNGTKTKKTLIATAILLALIVAATVAIIALKPWQFGKKAEKASAPFITKEVDNLIINEDITVPYGIRVLRCADDGIQIYWKKPENIKGYVIYRSYQKNRNFKLIDYIDDIKKFRNYSDNTFDTSKKRVYYCVRAVREVDGKDTYSNLSETATAKYRKKLKLDRKHIYMFSGTARKINAFHGWTNAHGVSWSSDNEKIATVNQEGEITAVSKGEASIKCTMNGKGQSAEVKVTVDREDEKMLYEKPEHRFEKDENGIYTNPNAEKTNEAVIMMVGDLMALSPHMKACRTKAGVYDFRPCYEYVKPVFAKSDLSIGNLETMIASEFSYGVDEANVDDRPNANTSATLLDALMYAGIDALPMSNNHNADCGVDGVYSTLDTIDRYGFPHTGVFSGKNDKRYIIFEVNGIKVGITSYTSKEMGFNHKDTTWAQNDVDTLLNYYSKEKAEKDLKDMKANGAEFCIVYTHWGVKNFFEPISEQYEKAQELADMGYDYIAGSHSHTIQKYADITAKDGRRVPCIYSLGDFSSQINQIEGNRDTLIMRIKIKKDENGKIDITENNYIPVYIYTKFADKPLVSMPLQPSLNGGLTNLQNREKYLNRIKDEIGSDIEIYGE